MKYLITLLIAALSLNAFGQMPYNPDSNADDEIDLPDLLTFLGVYGTTLVDSSLTCEYEGTDLEELIGGLHAQNLVLDSVYCEYLLIDTISTFLPECPEPVDIEVVLDRGYMMNDILFNSYGGSQYLYAQDYHLGQSRKLSISYAQNTGKFEMYMEDQEVSIVTSGGYTNISRAFYYDALLGYQASGFFLPFPQNWNLNEDGIQIDWSPGSWIDGCQEFRLIPYWHEAE